MRMYKIFERPLSFTKEKELIVLNFNPTTGLTWSADLVEVRPLGHPQNILYYSDFVYGSSLLSGRLPYISEVPLFERQLNFRNE